MLPKLDHTLANLVLQHHATGHPAGSSRFLVHYWGVNPQHFDNPVHRHSFFEVCYVISGHGTYMDQGRDFPLAAGTLFCSRPGVWHQIRSANGLYLLHVAYELRATERRLAEDPGIAQKSRLMPAAGHPAGVADDALVSLDESLRNTQKVVVYDAQAGVSTRLWYALLSQTQHHKVLPAALWAVVDALLCSFYATFTDGATDIGLRPSTRSSSDVDDLLRNAVTFIRDNLSQAPRLDGVARYFHVSGRHLSRLFATCYGLSFSDVLQQERMRRATELLRDTHLSVQSIAEQTGYRSVHHFTRAFHNQIGMPPGRYRANSGNGSHPVLYKG